MTRNDAPRYMYTQKTPQPITNIFTYPFISLCSIQWQETRIRLETECPS